MLIELAWVLTLLASLKRVPITVADGGFPWDAAIIAAAAVAAAGIAAYTAQRRLVAQLGHDRGMRDLEELRQILDEAAHLSAKAAGQTEKAFFSIQNHQSDRDEEVHTAKHLVEEMEAMHQRLRLRLGGDPVTGAYFFAVCRLGQAVKGLEDNTWSSPSNQDLNGASADIDAYKESFQQFMEFALARAGIDAGGEPSIST